MHYTFLVPRHFILIYLNPYKKILGYECIQGFFYIAIDISDYFMIDYLI